MPRDNDATQPLPVDAFDLDSPREWAMPGMEPKRTEPMTFAEMVETGLGILALVLFVACLIALMLFGLPEPKRRWVPAQPAHWEYVHPND